ncbi:MAG: class II aldolase/adducin family protein [Marinospirillum sp.]|uniref:class II aldolase/adducin family protein n=1 Tax=Marinospirillum sp. TaxID=2183934 RepID=UPI0019DA560E|nr:class II aldolase/adducin family protein [Marinospirillum sp.]MBE0507037.1 class II aldolase/adducin family protein [Marinospirillum sp.]
MKEGVIQFHCSLQPPKQTWPDSLLAELNLWRGKMIEQGWIGQDAARYQGLGFGNLSIRYTLPKARDAFIITASQSGHRVRLDQQGWPLVVAADIVSNAVIACGLRPPSSEALSHAALYQANQKIKAVIHVHSEFLWQGAFNLEYPSTAADIGYGTPAMANAIQQQAREDSGLLVMLGHQDGVLAWGESLQQAAEQLETLESRLG